MPASSATERHHVVMPLAECGTAALVCTSHIVSQMFSQARKTKFSHADALQECWESRVTHYLVGSLSLSVVEVSCQWVRHSLQFNVKQSLS